MLVLTLPAQLRSEVEKHYRSLASTTDQQVAHFALDGVDVYLTSNNYLLLEGVNALRERARWIKGGAKIMTTFTSHIGSDEVGTGSYFGPITVAAVSLNAEELPQVLALGVTDSKALNDDQILQIDGQLRQLLTYQLVVVDNEEYNRIINKNNHINIIKAIAHNTALIKVYQKRPQSLIVIDQFVNETKYYQYLKKVKSVLRNLTFITKAESLYPAVACASIIARAAYLRALDKDSQAIGYPLPKGASAPVDQFALALKAAVGVDELTKILKKYAKFDFKNTNRILS